MSILLTREAFRLVKYPRTYHLPWSQNITDDDRVMIKKDQFLFEEGNRIIVTEKMDGENTTLYNNYYHARSLNSRSHESQEWVKNFWSKISHDIPHGWRICGENLYAKHSIKYENLPSYFMGFSIWDHSNTCLSWNDTIEWFDLLGITPVPVLYDGVYNEDYLRALAKENKWDTSEGYVVRVASAFTYGGFRNCVGKYVRKNHVNTVKHWRYGQALEKNILKRP